MSATPTGAEIFPRLAGQSAELAELFRTWRGEKWSDDRFAELAHGIFELQFEANVLYRRFCQARGVDPGRIGNWREIPAVPTAAFRRIQIRSASSDDELRFLTSGTSRGRTERGLHIVPFPDLYRASARPAFHHFVLDDRQDSPLLLSLVPPFATTGDSSLAWMLDDLIEAFGTSDSISVAGEDGIDWRALAAECRTAERNAVPVCLLGTTLGFASWLSLLEQEQTRFSLPPGSVLMDTGGTKGRSVSERDEILDRLLPLLGLSGEQAANEFGMTELLSQRYGRGTGTQRLTGPPWLKTVVLDPVSLETRPDGSEGILCHYDLANLGSVIAVLTEDRGRIEDGKIVWLGRTPGAPPRGCSLATAELLAVQENG